MLPVTINLTLLLRLPFIAEHAHFVSPIPYETAFGGIMSINCLLSWSHFSTNIFLLASNPLQRGLFSSLIIVYSSSSSRHHCVPLLTSVTVQVNVTDMLDPKYTNPGLTLRAYFSETNKNKLSNQINVFVVCSFFNFRHLQQNSKLKVKKKQKQICSRNPKIN